MIKAIEDILGVDFPTLVVAYVVTYVLFILVAAWVIL